MRKYLSPEHLIFVLFGLLTILALTGCGSTIPVETPGATQVGNETPDVLDTPTAVTSPVPSEALEQPSDINPLTGLPPDRAELLLRRPVLVKIENLPRDNRPQFGLNEADLVYEYHTEEGTTRFAAIYYGRNAAKVGPIRSARFFDISLIQMYKAVFVFGSAYKELLARLFEEDFSDRLILEGPNTKPALYRFDPEGRNLLLVNLDELGGIIGKFDINNQVQNLKGMTFDPLPPQGGEPGTMVFIRFSSAIYNRWDYDPASGRYQRNYDYDNAEGREAELFTKAIDPVTGLPIAVDNVVVLLARNFVVTKGVYDIDMMGSGDAYIFRDGQIFPVRWERQGENDVLQLTNPDGSPFPFKPGQTWFEVMSIPTDVEQTDTSWRFTFSFPEG